MAIRAPNRDAVALVVLMLSLAAVNPVAADDELRIRPISRRPTSMRDSRAR